MKCFHQKRVTFTSPSAACLWNQLQIFKSKHCLVFKYTCPKIMINTNTGLGLNTVTPLQWPKLSCQSGRPLTFNILMFTSVDLGETYFNQR